MSTKFYFRCAAGHSYSSPVELTACLAVVKGVPCRAELKRLGSTKKAA